MKPGATIKPVRVHALRGLRVGRQRAHGANDAILYGHIRYNPAPTRAVHNRSAAQQQIKRALP